MVAVLFREFFLSASGMNRRTFETEEICATGGDVVHNINFFFTWTWRARGCATNAFNSPRYPSSSHDSASPRAQLYTFLFFLKKFFTPLSSPYSNPVVPDFFSRSFQQLRWTQEQSTMPVGGIHTRCKPRDIVGLRLAAVTVTTSVTTACWCCGLSRTRLARTYGVVTQRTCRDGKEVYLPTCTLSEPRSGNAAAPWWTLLISN